MTKSPKQDKKTLVELVESSNVHYPKIIMMLSSQDLLHQYEYESTTNKHVEPSMTESEFKKIIGA